jgi:hypothetical protein
MGEIYINCGKFLTGFSILCTILMAVTCIIGFIGFNGEGNSLTINGHVYNINQYWAINVLMAYLIFTSFLIILAEFELTIVLQWFAIMISAFGRGCVYIWLIFF